MKDIIFRKYCIKDNKRLKEMMNYFYHSPAVFTDGSARIFSKNVKALTFNPSVRGYVVENNNIVMGYAIISKMYNTEFGKKVFYLEDLYIDEKYRNKGIGDQFISYIISKNKNLIFKLEVEDNNEQAIKLYSKKGFKEFPYKIMVK